jgi:hypothetical protein
MDKYAVEASMVRRRIEHIRRKAPIMTVEDEGDVALLNHTLKTNASLAAVQESQMVPENVRTFPSQTRYRSFSELTPFLEN